MLRLLYQDRMEPAQILISFIAQRRRCLVIWRHYAASRLRTRGKGDGNVESFGQQKHRDHHKCKDYHRTDPFPEGKVPHDGVPESLAGMFSPCLVRLMTKELQGSNGCHTTDWQQCDPSPVMR